MPKVMTKPAAKPVAPKSRAAWLKRVRRMSAKARVPVIDLALASLAKTPKAENVFWRKELLRMRDASRLEAGLVTANELHQENSPFLQSDFRQARIDFRPRNRD